MHTCSTMRPFPLRRYGPPFVWWQADEQPGSWCVSRCAISAYSNSLVPESSVEAAVHDRAGDSEALALTD